MLQHLNFFYTDREISKNPPQDGMNCQQNQSKEQTIVLVTRLRHLVAEQSLVVQSGEEESAEAGIFSSLHTNTPTTISKFQTKLE